MKAFDYVTDPKLACLPLALRERMTQVQQARIDAGFTANNGMTYKDAETRDKVNAAMESRK
jgi:hypothetical protein